ncbi:MAG: 16S rRNA (guanine(966)-N(2))-methyltransferase RsmD [Clostridia bacterium]|nr:16S rRNA (guanine(966)-N(2))-methyltransferase RsmD [Clostridia bacterium]
MRIIAGTAKGRTLKSLKGMTTRPTLDRVREAVFNILGAKINNASVLDLFAGTGAIGLEALSRGAACCYFNDKNKAACRIIRENLTKCAFTQPVFILTMDALECISYLQKKGINNFDVIYLDPSYKEDIYSLLLKRILEAQLLAEEGIIIIETDKSTFLEEKYSLDQKEHQVVKLIKKNKYGDTVIWFYKLWGEE